MEEVKNELVYPMVFSTKEDYEFAVNNFPREYWETDLMELFMNSDFCEPVAIYTKGIEHPESYREITEEEKARFFKNVTRRNHYEVGKDDTRVMIETEIRKYFDKWYEVKPCFEKGSKADKLNIDYKWLSSRIFLSDEDNSKIDEINAQIDATLEIINKKNEELILKAEKLEEGN